jgi:hypothetical protein
LTAIPGSRVARCVPRSPATEQNPSGESIAPRGIPPGPAQSIRVSRRWRRARGTPGRSPCHACDRPRASTQAKVPLESCVGARRDQGDEKKAGTDLLPDRRIPRVAATQLAPVEPHFDPGRLKSLRNPSGSLRILGGIAEKDTLGLPRHPAPPLCEMLAYPILRAFFWEGRPSAGCRRRRASNWIFGSPAILARWSFGQAAIRLAL